MTEAISYTTRQFSNPYLTVAEYKDAPTAIDLDNLVYNNIDPEAQDQELKNTIARASSWIDTYCNQVLAATVETEQQRTRIRPEGTIIWHPRYNPVVALTDLNFGADPNNLVQVPNPNVCWIEPAQIIFPYAQLGVNFTSQGPLGFGYPSYGNYPIYLKYTYVNGYVNSVIVSAIATSTSLTVDRGTGILPGEMLRIYDGIKTEDVIVDSTYTFGSTTIPLTDPLIYDHDPGVSISALPPAIKEAAILVTTAFLKVRGDNSLVMGVGTQPSQIAPGAQALGEEIQMAKELLMPYRRIR